MRTKILIASHKKYKLPNDNSIYLPIFVGAAGHEVVPNGFYPDDSGVNISTKNDKYNELTAVYWAWKNLAADIIGIVQYRRYFVTTKKGKKNFDKILDNFQIEKVVHRGKIIVPRKRNYYIETIETHYLHTHSPQGLKVLKEVFQSQPLNYRDALDGVLSSRSAHMFNMFIMENSDFNEYCFWLFDILKKMEKRIDYSVLQGNERRVLGFIAELLLDVWVRANQKEYVEYPVLFMENQHWPKKIFIFLMNKLFGNRMKFNSHIK